MFLSLIQSVQTHSCASHLCKGHLFREVMVPEVRGDWHCSACYLCANLIRGKLCPPGDSCLILYVCEQAKNFN